MNFFKMIDVDDNEKFKQFDGQLTNSISLFKIDPLLFAIRTTYVHTTRRVQRLAAILTIVNEAIGKNVFDVDGTYASQDIVNWVNEFKYKIVDAMVGMISSMNPAHIAVNSIEALRYSLSKSLVVKGLTMQDVVMHVITAADAPKREIIDDNVGLLAVILLKIPNSMSMLKFVRSDQTKYGRVETRLLEYAAKAGITREMLTGPQLALTGDRTDNHPEIDTFLESAFEYSVRIEGDLKTGRIVIDKYDLPPEKQFTFEGVKLHRFYYGIYIESVYHNLVKKSLTERIIPTRPGELTEMDLVGHTEIQKQLRTGIKSDKGFNAVLLADTCARLLRLVPDFTHDAYDQRHDPDLQTPSGVFAETLYYVRKYINAQLDRIGKDDLSTMTVPYYMFVCLLMGRQPDLDFKRKWNVCPIAHAGGITAALGLRTVMLYPRESTGDFIADDDSSIIAAHVTRLLDPLQVERWPEEPPEGVLARVGWSTLNVTDKHEGIDINVDLYMPSDPYNSMFTNDPTNWIAFANKSTFDYPLLTREAYRDWYQRALTEDGEKARFLNALLVQPLLDWVGEVGNAPGRARAFGVMLANVMAKFGITLTKLDTLDQVAKLTEQPLHYWVTDNAQNESYERVVEWVELLKRQAKYGYPADKKDSVTKFVSEHVGWTELTFSELDDVHGRRAPTWTDFITAEDLIFGKSNTALPFFVRRAGYVFYDPDPALNLPNLAQLSDGLISAATIEQLRASGKRCVKQLKKRELELAAATNESDQAKKAHTMVADALRKTKQELEQLRNVQIAQPVNASAKAETVIKRLQKEKELLLKQQADLEQRLTNAEVTLSAEAEKAKWARIDARVAAEEADQLVATAKMEAEEQVNQVRQQALSAVQLAEDAMRQKNEAIRSANRAVSEKEAAENVAKEYVGKKQEAEREKLQAEEAARLAKEAAAKCAEDSRLAQEEKERLEKELEQARNSQPAATADTVMSEVESQADTVSISTRSSADIHVDDDADNKALLAFLSLTKQRTLNAADVFEVDDRFSFKPFKEDASASSPVLLQDGKVQSFEISGYDSAYALSEQLKCSALVDMPVRSWKEPWQVIIVSFGRLAHALLTTKAWMDSRFVRKPDYSEIPVHTMGPVPVVVLNTHDRPSRSAMVTFARFDYPLSVQICADGNSCVVNKPVIALCKKLTIAGISRCEQGMLKDLSPMTQVVDRAAVYDTPVRLDDNGIDILFGVRYDVPERKLSFRMLTSQETATVWERSEIARLLNSRLNVVVSDPVPVDKLLRLAESDQCLVMFDKTATAQPKTLSISGFNLINGDGIAEFYMLRRVSRLTIVTDLFKRTPS